MTTAFNIADGPVKSGSSATVIDVDSRRKVGSGLGVESTPRHRLLPCGSSAETSQVNLDALAGSQSFADVGALSASSRLRASTIHSLILRDVPINERRPARG